MDRPEIDDSPAGLAAFLSSPVVKRSVVISGHATSVSLEQPFWDALAHLAKQRETSLNTLISQIDDQRGGNNLSSALRLFVLNAVNRPEPRG